MIESHTLFPFDTHDCIPYDRCPQPWSLIGIPSSHRILGEIAGAAGDPCQPVVSLPSPDGWPDGAAELGVGAISSHVLRQPADRLGQPLAHGRVFLQQLQTLGHNVDPVLRKLRVPSQHVPASPIPKFTNHSRGLVRAAAPRGASHPSTGAPKS